jgi:hypothetical protein
LGVVISVIEIIVFSYGIVDMFAENFAKLNTAQEPSHNKVDSPNKSRLRLALQKKSLNPLK